MKILNKAKNATKRAVDTVRLFALDEHNMQAARGVLAAVLVVGCEAAHASGSGGLTTFFTNANSIGQLVIKFMILVGMVVGLGIILKGILDASKIGKPGHDDITWGSCMTKWGVGAAAMSLAFVATMIVTSMGGSASSIGQQLSTGQ